MIIVKDQIIANRGESFTIGFVLSKEYNGLEHPYYSQVGLKNPYYLLQVRNSEFYEKDKGSIYNYWIEVSVMAVKDAIPKKNCNLICCHGNPIMCQYSSVVEEQKIFGDRIPKQDDMVYGINEYQYPYIVIQNGPSLMSIDNEYPWTMFKKTFLPVDTKQFRQGTWWYELFLVEGTKTLDYLQSKYKSFFDERTSDNWQGTMNTHEAREYQLYKNSPKWLYDRICSLEPEFKDSIRWDRPLLNYSTVDKISEPKKFIVR